ncbi:glycoside hydrolase TIM-barrel-like domain-containing protein [Pseudoruegeria sp. SHC-113]|uniref:baseplate multidomain protein megatron n=1 Tax=Pseudoruegeria sp. SHC-113 TaxID=2855439 RepID=UPI0021BBB08C|nr:glycoside hydrolase TIM-barrel-like domain-containing protein [Pseudoruegeria sp. SHC-113]
MATLVLGAAGAAIGGSIGGAILGVSAATIGGFVGSTIGSVVDSWIVSSLAPTQRIEGPRLDSLRITSSTEGAVIPRVYGRMRMGGNVIWATDFREETKTTTQGGGKGGGGGGKVKTTEYLYYASFAVALCEGPVTGIGRIWADGKLLDTASIIWRWYPGDESQAADPFIAAKMGAANTPAYRGTAYVVFEDLPLGNFGNRLPQLSFEVFRPLADPDTAEGLTQAVTMIPASGEFTYATTGIRKGSGGAQTPENLNALSDTADMVVALDRLQAMAPKVESVSLVVAWFGNDLRAGECKIRPGVEVSAKSTSPQTWSVNGVSRANAHLVSRDDQDRPTYGGTPADFAVIQAIKEMKARGLRVTFYPFILMDVPPGNTLPNPYSDNAAEAGQPVFPWRGRITCSPAAGYAGSVDKTAAAASQVAAFFGSASPSDFAVSGETISWTGSAGDWGLRRMVLHYAHLCAAAGGVDAFLIGSELRGLTTIRDSATTYPAVAQLQSLAADVRSILGPGTAISYAADWSEYFGHQPGDGSGDVFFHLDPLWADTNIDFVGIDNYMPLSDWRDGFEHADAQEGWPAIYDRAYLQKNIAGGEGFDWFYASDTDRSAQVRTPISDGVYGEPWVFRYKDLWNWWSRPHHDRQGGLRTNPIPDGDTPATWSPTTTTVSPRPEGFGPFTSAARIAAIDGSNDFAQSASAQDLVVAGETYETGVLLKPGTSGSARIYVNLTGAPNKEVRIDDFSGAAPYTSDPDIFDLALADIGGGIWRLTFNWIAPITDTTVQLRVGPYSSVPGEDVHVLAGWITSRNRGTTPWLPQSKPIRFTELGCPAIDRGTNQPNVFFDPKSSESFTPHFSRGWRDDAIQRAYLEATWLFWADPTNNPLSSVYGGRMVDAPQCAAWTWDARPYPFFPELTDVWTDGPNWRLGHWLTGRLGAVSLAALVRHLCLRAGLPEDRIDVSGLWGAVEGYAITALESPRASITTLARHFGFDAVETEGVIRFVMRGRAAVATVSPDDLVAPREGDVLELTRGQETELPQALKWQVARADEDYEAAQVEARRITVDTTRIASESFPMAVPPEEAERRCRRALMEAWTARESAVFRLPPSRLALDPADVVSFTHDGRAVPLRLVSIADADARGIEAVRQDREAYDLPPGAPRPSALSQAVVFGAPEAVLLDLPQLTEDQPAHRPLVAAHAVPWPGEIAVFRSPSTDGFELLTTFGSRVRIGALVSDLYAGPTSRFDLGNVLVVDLLSGTLESVTDLTLFGGANALAIESTPGVWEIVQAGAAELIAPGRYRLTRLLRGQRGTEDAMGNPAPAGARVVVLDTALASMPIAEADLGIRWNWRIGPASRPVSDETYVAQNFTPQGVGLRPFSVAHVEQPWRKPRAPGDLTIRWTRRSRALAADSWGGLEVPLGEEIEAYEVEILDGATVKRVLSTATTSAVYTDAQQTADWGAPLGPGDTLDIRIFQLSALIGRGAPKTVTLTL